MEEGGDDGKNEKVEDGNGGERGNMEDGRVEIKMRMGMKFKMVPSSEFVGRNFYRVGIKTGGAKYRVYNAY